MNPRTRDERLAILYIPRSGRRISMNLDYMRPALCHSLLPTRQLKGNEQAKELLRAVSRIRGN
jgi:hypothetical protein